MKNRILFTLAFALVTSQAYSMSPQQRAAKLRQEETNRAAIKANINKIEKADAMRTISSLQNETQQLINNTPRGPKEFQNKLDNAVQKGQENVLASIQKISENVVVKAQAARTKIKQPKKVEAPQAGRATLLTTQPSPFYQAPTVESRLAKRYAEKQRESGLQVALAPQYSQEAMQLKTVSKFANEQRALVQSFAQSERFNGPRKLQTFMGMPTFFRQGISFMAVVAGNYFDVNKDELKELSNAISDSVSILTKDAISKVDKGFIEKNKSSLTSQLNATRFSILEYKNMLISTYVNPLIGKDNETAKSFKNDTLNSTNRLMKAAARKALITQDDMTSFKTQYNDLLNK